MTLPPRPSPPPPDPPTGPHFPSPRAPYEHQADNGNLHAAIADAVEIAEREGIHWGFWAFPLPYQGIYYYRGPGRAPLIGLAQRLIHQPAVARSVFYEELGHHMVSVGLHIPFHFHNQAERLVYSKMEKQALRWAATRLIPTALIVTFAERGGGTVRALAALARVTEEIAAERIDLLRTYEPALYQRLLLLYAGDE